MSKILLISTEFPPGPGGIGKHAHDFAVALANKGYSIDVISKCDYASEEEILKFKYTLPPNIILKRLYRHSFLSYFKRLHLIYNSINKNLYDRIVVSGSFSLYMILIIRCFFGKKNHIDAFVHGSEVKPNSKLKKILTQYSLLNADIIWPVSTYTKTLLPNKVLNQKKTEILSNGIHLSEWNDIEKVSIGKIWKGSPKLLTVGNISDRKGQHRVIKALPSIIREFPHVHYHIVGLDKNAEKLILLAKQLKVEEYITIHGKVKGKNELANAYKNTDVFVMLSENQKNGDVEGFGIAILEANFFDLPALGALNCGIEDAIENGINGELVDGEDIIGIANTLKIILTKKENKLYSCENWIKKFDWNELINKFIEKGN